MHPISQHWLVFDACMSKVKRRRFGDFNRHNCGWANLFYLLQFSIGARNTPDSVRNRCISRLAIGLVSPLGLL